MCHNVSELEGGYYKILVLLVQKALGKLVGIIAFIQCRSLSIGNWIFVGVVNITPYNVMHVFLFTWKTEFKWAAMRFWFMRHL